MHLSIIPRKLHFGLVDNEVDKKKKSPVWMTRLSGWGVILCLEADNKWSTTRI